MSAHPREERLHDYVDGLLEPGDRRAVESHLETCAVCRGEVDSIRHLVGLAAGLPRSVEPPASLWRAVAARTVERRDESMPAAEGPAAGGSAETASRPAWGRVLRFGGRSLRSVRWELAAAAVALVALSSVVTTVLVRGGAGGPSPAGASRVAAAGTTGGATGPASGATLETMPGSTAAPGPATAASLVDSEYEPTVARLRAELAARRSELSPATIAVVESNLQVIDRAIAETRAALAADPSSRPAASLLATMYRQKIGVLEQTLRLGT